MERTLGSVWTGLNKNPWSSFKFTDNSIPEYLYWERGQPDSQLDERACVKAVVSGTRVGRWDDVNCTQKNFYVCEIYNGKIRLDLNNKRKAFLFWSVKRVHLSNDGNYNAFVETTFSIA